MFLRCWILWKTCCWNVSSSINVRYTSAMVLWIQFGIRFLSLVIVNFGILIVMYQNIVNKIVRDVCQINGWTKIEILSVFLFTEFINSLLVFCVLWFNLLDKPLYCKGSNCVKFDFVRVCSLVDRYFYCNFRLYLK